MYSLYHIEISKYIDPELIVLIDDVVRLMVIQIIVQSMFALSNAEGLSGTVFFSTLLYTGLGVCVYWLVFKKLVTFK
jgi:hypothetical protein